MSTILKGASGQHTPHLRDEALSWHSRYLKTGNMMPVTQEQLQLV